MKTYWKPHFITKLVEVGGENYYKTGIHEVHYENDIPVLWSANPCDIVAYEDELEDSLSQCTGLFKLYQSALTNKHFKEIKEDGIPTLIEL